MCPEGILKNAGELRRHAETINKHACVSCSYVACTVAQDETSFTMFNSVISSVQHFKTHKCETNISVFLKLTHEIVQSHLSYPDNLNERHFFFYLFVLVF